MLRQGQARTPIWMFNYSVQLFQCLGRTDFVGSVPCPSLNLYTAHSLSHTHKSLYVWVCDFIIFPPPMLRTLLEIHPKPCYHALQAWKSKENEEQRAKCRSLTQVAQSVIIHCSPCTPALYPDKLFTEWYEVSSVRNTSFIAEKRRR